MNILNKITSILDSKANMLRKSMQILDKTVSILNKNTMRKQKPIWNKCDQIQLK